MKTWHRAQSYGKMLLGMKLVFSMICKKASSCVCCSAIVKPSQSLAYYAKEMGISLHCLPFPALRILGPLFLTQESFRSSETDLVKNGCYVFN